MATPEIVPLTGRIGAEIRGVRLVPDLEPAVAATVRDAWLRHKVVCFRGQDHLDDASQEALAGIFGATASPHPTVPAADGTQSVYALDSRLGSASYWHTDLTWAPELPRGAILRAVVVPPAGGDTLWANTATAYDDLPPRLRAIADREWALHSNGSDHDSRNDTASQHEFWSAFQSAVLETRHPLVHVHPETRERCLLLGAFVKRILGRARRDSLAVQARLQGYVTRPENTMRWHWQAGDVAVWDNRSTQHYATADYGDATRIMRRVSLDGEPTESLYGERSWTEQRGASLGRWRRPVGVG